MILLSSQTPSEIIPSQPKRAALGDPQGGEIPMASLTELGLLCAYCQGRRGQI